MSESLVFRTLERGDLITDAGAFLNAEIAIEVYRRQPCVSHGPPGWFPFLGVRWTAEITEETLDTERVRYFSGFARKHFSEIITISRFGKGVIQWFGVDREIKIKHGDIVNGNLVFDCEGRYACKMKISGIGPLVIRRSVDLDIKQDDVVIA